MTGFGAARRVRDRRRGRSRPSSWGTGPGDLADHEWGDILKRLTDRHGREGHHNVLAELGRASFYEHGHYLFRYPEPPGVAERTIDTTGQEAESVADAIIRVAGL